MTKRMYKDCGINKQVLIITACLLVAYLFIFMALAGCSPLSSATPYRTDSESPASQANVTDNSYTAGGANRTDNVTNPGVEISDSPPNPWDYRLETYPDGSHKWIRVNQVPTSRPANWP